MNKKEAQYKFTKGDINRLGDEIRKQKNNLSDETLNQLQSYRISYKDSLANTFIILCESCKQIRNNSIVTYRIKRFESIISKLERHSKMQFSRMWDIAGCRCIMQNVEDINKLKSKLSKNFRVIKEYDYLSKPKNDGYKALHLFIRLKSSEEIIEVQLRTRENHNWATLVEITDLLYDTKLKESNNNQKYGNYKRFHLLLAQSPSSLSMKDKKEIFHYEKKFDYLNTLTKIFSRNYLTVRKQWLKIEGHSQRNYFLIESNKNEPPIITSYTDFSEAETEYFNKFQHNNNSNTVLTHIQNANYKKISIAYSNYILTVHNFIEDCFLILENLIQEALNENKYFDFAKYFKLYLKITVNDINNVNSEILELSSFLQEKKNSIKVSTWNNEIKHQVKNRIMKANKLVKIFRNSNNIPFPKSILYVHTIINLNKRFQKKINNPSL